MDQISKNCPLGVQNATRLDNMEVTMQELGQTMKDITKKLDRFVPVWLTFVLSIMTGITTGLIVKCLTKGA